MKNPILMVTEKWVRVEQGAARLGGVVGGGCLCCGLAMRLFASCSKNGWWVF